MPLREHTSFSYRLSKPTDQISQPQAETHVLLFLQPLVRLLPMSVQGNEIGKLQKPHALQGRKSSRC